MISTLPMVVSVNLSPEYTFSKPPVERIRLIAGLGVEGDAHMGATVKHRSRAARDAGSPNLRQVHLLHSELFEELGEAGFVVGPGDIGENISTRGIDLLGLSQGARVRIGESAVLEITGLRNPCAQLDAFQPGLMAAVLDRSSDGRVIRKAGIMAVVAVSGEVHPGDAIWVERPRVHRRLEPV